MVVVVVVVMVLQGKDRWIWDKQMKLNNSD